MTRKIKIGNMYIGGDSPVSIQSMLNIDTLKVDECVTQVVKLADAGCEIVRLTVPTEDAAVAFGEIKRKVRALGYDLPFVADIHFDYMCAIKAIENGADKVRINPGNIGSIDRVRAVVEKAKEYGIPIRVGVNSGSLERDILEKNGGVTAEGLAESALRNVKILEEMDFHDIVISLKASDVKMNFEAYKIVSEACDYPLHVGVTEAGTPEKGRIKSACGIGALLLSGIGDTMRVSLTGDPVNEIYAAIDILEAVGLRHRGINIVSCPTCGRTKVDLEKIVRKTEELIKPIEKQRKIEGKRGLTLAIMGCIVNGPGEAREADLGVASGDGKGAIFIKGKTVKTVKEEEIPEELASILKDFD